MDSGKIEKFRAALNALGQKICGEQGKDAYDHQQAEELLEQYISSGEDPDTVIACMCAHAYGVENLALKDVSLLINTGFRSRLRAVGRKLEQDGGGSPWKKMIDVLCSHWDDFSDDERLIIADSVVELSKLRQTQEAVQ